MTWDEIFRRGQAGKSIPVATLPRDARNELARTSHDDIDDIVELRPAGKPRAWGVRHDNVLMLLFWDPNHTLFPPRNRRRPTGN